jgi:hypothetical protein
VYNQVVAFHQLGDKAKDFIEQGHQERVADGQQLKHMKNHAKKQSSALGRLANLSTIRMSWQRKKKWQERQRGNLHHLRQNVCKIT